MQECGPLKFRKITLQLRIEKLKAAALWNKNIISLVFYSQQRQDASYIFKGFTYDPLFANISTYLELMGYLNLECRISASQKVAIACFLLANLVFTSLVIQHFLHIKHHVSLRSSHNTLAHLSYPGIVTFVPLIA